MPGPDTLLACRTSPPTRSFCTKPAVTNGQTQGTVIRGPQLNITVSGGKCSVAADLGARQKQINCTGPSVSYSKVQPSVHVGQPSHPSWGASPYV